MDSDSILGAGSNPGQVTAVLSCFLSTRVDASEGVPIVERNGTFFRLKIPTSTAISAIVKTSFDCARISLAQVFFYIGSKANQFIKLNNL